MEKTDHSHSYDSSLLERLLFRVAKKWVAGYSKEEAVAAATSANTHGMAGIINFLGEEATSAEAVGGAVGEYLSLMDLMHDRNVRGCVSAKPTQLGLGIGYDMCLENFKKLAARASAHGQFVWMDMESIKFAEDTISIYLELFRDYEMTGLAIQSYLRRSAGDLLHIMEEGGKVRLVKGAYHEPEEQAFSTREEVDASFSKLMKMLFDGGSFFAIATHDSKLIDEAISLFKDQHFEFELLMGIRDELKRDLVAKGFSVAEYIPYGTDWLPYSVRRIRERKRNLILLARSLVQS